MGRGKPWIGTSGWNYKDWRGMLYPQGVPQRKWLSHYSHQFPTVELNSSFYRIPSDDALEEWVRTAPSRFRFAAKLWRGITHFRKLRNCEQFVENYMGVLSRFPPPQRGPLLVQLPPNLKQDLDRLDSFLALLKRHAPGHWKTAVEFRRDDWLQNDTFRVLDRHRTALCLHDGSEGSADTPNDASFVYLRRHGPGGDISRPYTKKQLEKDAKAIGHWLEEGKTVFLYFNNDPQGNAVQNARELTALLE